MKTQQLAKSQSKITENGISKQTGVTKFLNDKGGFKPKLEKNKDYILIDNQEDPSTQEAEAPFEFEASLVYEVSSWPAKAK